MKCSRMRKLIVTADLGTLPPAAARHMEICPTCAVLHRRTVQVRELVALKRYETPDPTACDRAVNRFRHRDAAVPAPTGRAWSLLGLPTAASGVAAACLALLGVQLHSSGPLPALNSAITQTDVRSLEEFLTSGHPNEYQPFFTILPTSDLSFSNNPAIPRRPRNDSVFFVSE
jgi:hypothetical protein